MIRSMLKAGAMAVALFGAAPALAQGDALTSKGLVLKPFVLTRLSDLSFGSIIP